MIQIHGAPPRLETVRFFEHLVPGIWNHVLAAAGAVLTQIDEGNVGETIVTSWFRSVNENRRAGGHPDSQHLVGLALDVVPGKGTSELALNEAAQIFRGFGFIVEPESDHVHVQVFPPGILRPAGVLDVLHV